MCGVLENAFHPIDFVRGWDCYHLSNLFVTELTGYFQHELALEFRSLFRIIFCLFLLITLCHLIVPWI